MLICDSLDWEDHIMPTHACALAKGTSGSIRAIAPRD